MLKIKICNFKNENRNDYFKSFCSEILLDPRHFDQNLPILHPASARFGLRTSWLQPKNLKKNK